MTRVDRRILRAATPEHRWAVMKKTAIGLIDIDHNFNRLSEAYLDMLDLPAGDYEIVRIVKEVKE